MKELFSGDTMAPCRSCAPPGSSGVPKGVKDDSTSPPLSALEKSSYSLSISDSVGITDKISYSLRQLS